MTGTPTDEQIEAAARAIREVIAQRIWAVSKVAGEPIPFDKLEPFWQECYRAEARAALEAAEALAWTKL